jgi:hypothetical protein
MRLFLNYFLQKKFPPLRIRTHIQSIRSEEFMLDTLEVAPLKKPRGIAPGTTATSPASSTLEKSTKEASKLVFDNLKHDFPRLTWRPKLTPEEIIQYSGYTDVDPSVINGIMPDGGVFLYDHESLGMTPLFATEAKHQGRQGNAIERWFKNYNVVSGFGIYTGYITFCSGAGAVDNGVITKTLNNAFLSCSRTIHRAKMRDWNRLYMDGPSLYASEFGFTTSQMYSVIMEMAELKIHQLKYR